MQIPKESATKGGMKAEKKKPSTLPEYLKKLNTEKSLITNKEYTNTGSPKVVMSLNGKALSLAWKVCFLGVGEPRWRNGSYFTEVFNPRPKIEML